MNKKIPILIITLLLSLSPIYSALAQETEKVVYPNKVNVSIHKAANLTLALNGNYQMVNLETKEVKVVPTNTTINIKKDSKGVTLSFSNVIQSSITGFEIEELTGGLSLAMVSNGSTYRGSFILKPNGSQVEVINYLDMEDYLKGVVPNEMPASWHIEALKAQAIAARSYAKNVSLLTSTATSQVYKGYSGESTRANQAIKETEGLMIQYNGKPIQAFFHSTSGGATANVGDVWNSDQKNFPYLVSVESPYESSALNSWTETFSPSTILSSFGLNENAEIYDITLTKSGANGEVSAVTVKSSVGIVTKSGNEGVIKRLFPLQNANYYNMLYSNWFDISLTRSEQNISVQTNAGSVAVPDLNGQWIQTSNGQMKIENSTMSIQMNSGIISNGNGSVTSIVLNGKGWGHRIGLSQYGAKGFAENGWTAEQILTHYFRGTTISK